MAKRVKEHGKAFETLLRDKEKDNAKFAFLRDDEVGLPCLTFYHPSMRADLMDSCPSTIFTDTLLTRHTVSHRRHSCRSTMPATRRATRLTRRKTLNGRERRKARSAAWRDGASSRSCGP